MGYHPQILSHVTQTLGVTSPSESWVSPSFFQAVWGTSGEGGFFSNAVIILWLA